MIKNANYNVFFKCIYAYYCLNIHDISFFNFDDIYICDNIKNGLLQLGITDQEAIDQSAITQGCTILPIHNLKKMIVLIEVSGKLDFEDAKALIHELTHVYDFTMYAIEFNNGVIENFRTRTLFDTYTLFSEFHAHSVDEYEAIKYLDFLNQSNSIDSLLHDQETLLTNFLLKKRKSLVNRTFSAYDLFTVLGKFYYFDQYNHISSIEYSCIYQYLPILFHSRMKQRIFDLYDLCWIVMQNRSIFEMFEEFEDLLNQIIPRSDN